MSFFKILDETLSTVTDTIPIYYTTNDPERSKVPYASRGEEGEEPTKEIPNAKTGNKYYQEVVNYIFKYNPFKQWCLVSDFSKNPLSKFDFICGLIVTEVRPEVINIEVTSNALPSPFPSFKFSFGIMDDFKASYTPTGIHPETMKALESKMSLEDIKRLISSMQCDAVNQVYQFLKTKNSGNMIEGLEKRKFKIKNKDKRFIKFKGISHVAKYKQGKVIYDPSLVSSIEWTYSTLVSGHWRKIDGIGKDREGMYNQEGFTWVIPHQRNKDLPHRENIRVMK